MSEPLATLVLVEDEHIMRRSLARLLERSGYRVFCFADAESAIAELGALPPFEFLVTDLLLSDRLSGADLAVVVLRERPGTHLVFITGYAADHIKGVAELLSAGGALLAKPFAFAALRETLERLGDAAPDAGPRGQGGGAAS